MLHLLDHFVSLLLKLVSYLLLILFVLSSFQFLTKLIEDPTTVEQLIYVFKTFPSLSILDIPVLIII